MFGTFHVVSVAGEFVVLNVDGEEKPPVKIDVLKSASQRNVD